VILRQCGKGENSYEANGKAAAKGHHRWCSLSIGPRSGGPAGDDRRPKRPKDGYARALW
jgi:hypothetical protein